MFFTDKLVVHLDGTLKSRVRSHNKIRSPLKIDKEIQKPVANSALAFSAVFGFRPNNLSGDYLLPCHTGGGNAGDDAGLEDRVKQERWGRSNKRRGKS